MTGEGGLPRRMTKGVEMILTATPDRWDYRRAFRSSLSVTAEGQGRWSASTQLMDLGFEIELQQICAVAVLRVSCQCREHYTFVPPMLPPEAMREVIEERLVDEILWAYDKNLG